ncbi:MAG: alkaline phosphatase [Candidatus Micrarchaeota archaeon]|nr:MAG: alkaline phosphatase [Candidatus Micrarchaeota archaeon]
MSYFALLSIISGFISYIPSIIKSYGYIGIIALMILESASVPIPSEVVLPLSGFLAYQGLLNIYLAIAASVIGSIIGILIDYYIGYIIGKDVIYKHSRRLHISKESIDSFDRWFNKNGKAAVLFVRFIPLLRGLVSFPAGFSRMSIKDFILYSAVGIVAYNTVLIYYGFYLGKAYSTASGSSYTVIAVMLAAFAIALYMIYYIFMRYIAKK